MADPVSHHWRGDTKLLHDTAHRRTEIRKALQNLQQELQDLLGCPTQIQAEIKFNISGTNPREHCYTVSATGSGFDADAFARTKTVARAPSGTGAASSPPANNTHRPSRGSLEDDDDDVVLLEDRPAKRPRTGEDGANTTPYSRSRNAGSLSEDPTTIQRVSEVLSFVKDWHGEWTRQGGWLFDTLNSASKANTGTQLAIDKKLDAVQDVLGQSINAASASAMAELANITKLLPWLEHCRKTNADKVQAREEKWRSSSATFHDQNRRDREAAEKQIKEQLESQRLLLIKIAEANGIDVDEEDKHSEASLGAQLTAELNLEASRQDDSRKNSRQDPMHIED